MSLPIVCLFPKTILLMIEFWKFCAYSNLACKYFLPVCNLSFCHPNHVFCKGNICYIEVWFSVFPLWRTVTQTCISKTFSYIVSKSFSFFFFFSFKSRSYFFFNKVKDLAQSSFICCFCLFILFSLMAVQLLQHFLQKFFPLLINIASFLEINWV